MDNFRVYEKNEKYLVLNPEVPSWIVTNINGVLVLTLYQKAESFEQTAEKFCIKSGLDLRGQVIRFLKKAEGASLFQSPKRSPVHKPYKLNSIYLNMTEECNLRCIYCFAESRIERGTRLGFTDYVRILDQAATITDNLTVTFTGGEPILSELTIPIAQYAKKKNFQTYLLSNGTLINEANIDNLLNCFDYFKISLDGSTPEIHEFFRGPGTYLPTVESIKLLKERNANVLIPMTVTKKNINDISRMFEMWGNLVTFQPLFPLGNALDNNYLEISGAEYYDNLVSDGSINPYKDIGNIINAHKLNRTIYKCAVGDGQLSISCTGDVYPCQLLHSPEFLIGNVKGNDLQELYNSSRNAYFKYHTVDKIDGCKTCDLKYLCGGACQARHYSETGTIEKAGCFCEYEKKGIINGIISNYELEAIE